MSVGEHLNSRWPIISPLARHPSLTATRTSESPPFPPATHPVANLAILTSSSQPSFPSTIAAHASSRSTSGVPSVMRATSSINNPPFPSPASEQPPARSFMGPGTPNGDPDSPTCQTPDVDPQILEALRSKDRLYVLKLGEAMESLINERRPRVELTSSLFPSTSYQRLLVHRCTGYYKLTPENDPGNKGIAITLTGESRIPARRICELVPAETTAQPAFKIMRRMAQDRIRNKPQSQSGSTAGEEADLSDVEPSESGSVGGRSNATGGSSKKRMTIEEREAAYNEARSRIFMDFDEKEKGKDMNASSSSLSLASGSASTSSGLDDFEDSVGSPTTESEWSGSVTRDKKDIRRGLRSFPSSRSLQSNATPFNTNGSNSSRGSRASSPSSFTYASLYEPPCPAPYDTSHMPPHLPGAIYPTPYMYPYPLPGQASHLPYAAPYPLYAPYPYPPNVLPSAEQPPSSGHLYSPTHPGYEHPYAWPHLQQPPASIPHQLQAQPHPAGSPGPALSQNAPHFQPAYMAAIPYAPPYPLHGYYPPPAPPQHHLEPVRQPLPHMPAPPPMFTGDPHRHLNGHPPRSTMNGNCTGNSSRTSSRNSSGSGINGRSKRSGPPASRPGWSHSPTINSSFTYGGSGAMSGMGPVGADPVVGPRLSAPIRRSSVSSSGNKGSAGDEASSTASSSTTSSSSLRIYTSTSSQHPLPPRPDWAVGLKPQPTLHTPHPRHYNSPGAEWSGIKSSSILPVPLNNSRNMSPAKNGEDFPPLSSVTTPADRRPPVVGGAWTNLSSTRSILIPSPGHVHSTTTTLMNHSVVSGNANEHERGYERPPPKGNVELFNPRIARRPNIAGKSSPQQAEQERDISRGEAVASAILVGQVMSLTLEESGGTDAVKKEITVAAVLT